MVCGCFASQTSIGFVLWYSLGSFQFARFVIFTIVLVFVLCLANSGFVQCCSLAGLPSVRTLCNIQQCSCMRALPHRHRNFLSRARFHITCRMIALPIVGCCPFDLAVLERVVLVVLANFCSGLYIFDDSPWGERRRRTNAHYDGNLDSEPFSAACSVKSAIMLATCNSVINS